MAIDGSRLRIIVTGLIAQYPLGGVTWDYVQYAAGLARLGHDVFYVEDTGQWPYNPAQDGLTDDPSYNIGVLAEVMRRFDLGERWAYRFPRTGAWFGMTEARRTEVVRSADLLVNISGTLARPDEYRGARKLAYIDTDPVFTQVKIARGQEDLRRTVDQHDVHFSFGERIGAFEPSTGHAWHPTRQPVLLDEWATGDAPSHGAFTTVMNWTSYNAVEFRGETYGQKDQEFRKFVDLPAAVSPAIMELAVNAGRTKRTPHDLLMHRGWRIVSPSEVCADLDGYRAYIQSSHAEWSVAKQAYVAGGSGWFSCRSACYLAAGRPVVVQDTSFSPPIPAGEGVVAFSSLDEAAAGIRDVVSRYERHARVARDIAETYFDARRVLSTVVETAMAGKALAAEVSS
jgi:hypothetical protein